jgi:hypothetical protein
MVLECARDNFRSGGRPAVNQDNNRQSFGQIARCCIVAFNIVFAPATGGDNFSTVEEGIRDGNGLIQ